MTGGTAEAPVAVGDRPRASARSRQLDIFRGIAAIFMVMNHAGYHLLGPNQSYAGWPGALVFAASAAPALFFFATGVGSGMATGGSEAWYSAVRKVVLLLLADTVMNWGFGTLLGLDFFGFAAISTAAMYLVRRASRPAQVAACMLALVVATRFAIGPLLRGWIQDDTVFAFATGVGFVTHVSYPLCPWLAFPLAGFLVGRLSSRQASAVETMGALGIGAVGLAAAQAMAWQGEVVHRWGAVSLAYFVFAVAIVAPFWVLTAWLAKPRVVRVDGLFLRGPASLLIVPLHYGALGLVERWLVPPWSPMAWLAGTTLMCVVVLVSARAIVATFGARVTGDGATAGWIALALACAATLAAFFCASPLWRLEVACVAQVVVALVLLVSTRKPRPGQAVAETGAAARGVSRKR